MSMFFTLYLRSSNNLITSALRPNHDGQASIDPGYGATLWRQYLEPLKASGYRLVSPAVTSAPSGKTWLKNFLSSCGGCHVRPFP